MSFQVLVSPEAEDDLDRLFDFLLNQAHTPEDLEAATHAIEAIRAALTQQLATTPYSFRKAGTSPTRRELIIPFRSAGYVALYEIASPSLVVVLAVRHQLEEDYH